MTVQMQIDARSLSSRRWFLLTLSVLAPLILLSAILLSARVVEAEPLAPTADLTGTVVNPDGSTIGGDTVTYLFLLDEWDDLVFITHTDVYSGDGSFSFDLFAIPSEFVPNDFFVRAETWGDDYFDSLPVVVPITGAINLIDVGDVPLTYASFEGMVYEPGGVTLADGGYVSVVDGDWNDVAWGDYYTGAYAIGSVPPGNFMLVAHPPGDSLFWHSDPVSVTVAPGSQYLITETQAISLELIMAQLAVYVDDTSFDPITANVHLWNEWGDVDWWMWATPDHPATFGDLAVGEVFMIEAWPDWTDVPTQANSIVMTVTIEALPISRTLALRIPDIVGTIETPEGDPLPPAYEGEDPIPHPARIHVHSESAGFDIETMTNPDGEFSLALPDGNYDLEAHPNGNLAFTYTKSLHEHFSIPVGTVMPPLNVRLTYPSVVGEVFDPIDNPLPPDACLDVWLENMQGEWMADYWYCGGQDWPYMLGGVPDGDYWLKTNGVPELGFFPPAPIFVHVPPGSQYDPDAVQIHDLYLTGAQIEVFVEHPPGTLVPAHVVLWDEWGFEAWGDNMLDGPAQFGGMNPGDYWLQAWPTWQDIPDLANSVREAIHVGETPTSYTLYLNVPDITGTVETPQGNPLPQAHDEEGSPVPHPAEVHVHSLDWTVDLWATTNPTGEFSLFLPDGEYELLAKPLHDLVFDYTKSELVPFTLSPAVTRPHGLGHIPLTYPRIWGMVMDQEGWLVSTWVNVWSDDGSYWDGDSTGLYGTEVWKPFLFGGMPPGHYFVQADPPADNPAGYGPSEVLTFTVPPTYTEQITLHLGIANVLGDVRLPPDDPGCPDCPVPWVDVIVRRDPDDGFEKWATTGEDGRFAFRLQAGDYVLEVELPPEWLGEWEPPDPDTFTLGPPPDQYTPTLYLKPSAERILVTGQVNTPPLGDPPPEDTTWVDLCNDEGVCFGDEVAASGHFTVPVLPGFYKVWVWVDPMTGFAPPLDNGFPIFVEDDLELDPIWLGDPGARAARVSGQVIISPTGVGLPGVEIEAWAEGSHAFTQTVAGGNYSLNLFPGYWHGGPSLTPEQEDEYIVLPPRYRDGYLEDGDKATGVNFYLLRRDATIRGQVVEVGQTTPITDIDAIVFAEHCGDEHCRIVAESQVENGTFELNVVSGTVYALGVWLPSGGYMPGPPVTVTVASTLTTGVRVEVIKAGTRIWGRLMDGDSLEYVEIDATVYGHDPEGLWVEDWLQRGDDPYQYNLYVPTPVDEPITWTLGLGVHPSTGYIPDPAHPKYKVVVEPGDTNVGQIMYVKELDTFIVGRVGIMADGTFTPTPHIWIFAEGSVTATEGLYFEAETNASGIFTIPVLLPDGGEYLVGAYLPPHLADEFFPPPPEAWDSMSDNPVELLFHRRPTGEGALEICGGLSVSPTGSISDTAPIFVSGWSDDGYYSEVTGTIAGGYCIPVISDTTWYVWTAYEDPNSDAFYYSQEEAVNVINDSVDDVDLALEEAPYDLPDTECWTFDPSRFKRLSLPAWGDLPEPLVEIQAGTMPVTDDVTICATPLIAVPNGQNLIGYAYEMEAWDSRGNLITQDFDHKVRFIFYFSADALDGIDPEELEMGFYSTARGEWVSLEDLYIDPEDMFATGKIDHFTRMGVMSPPAKEKPPSGGHDIYLPLVLRNFGG